MSDKNITDFQIRGKALEMAIESCPDADTEDLMERAKSFYDFLKDIEDVELIDEEEE